MSKNCIIGRQPILDRDEHLYGYELLFRSTDVNQADILDAGRATANVIVNTLASFGIAELLGGRRGFINVDLDMLMDEVLELLPQEHVVIELLESIEPSPPMIERCRMLKEAGFILALDDHQYSPDFAELYAIIDIVKVDLLQTPLESLPDYIEHLRPYPCKLLAEKVESMEQFSACHALGFDYFQGYYFARPDIIKKKKMDDDATNLLKLMRLLAEDADTEVIEQAFRGSPSLTYKLLMLVNSVAFGQRHKIQGVGHAIAMTGRVQIKRWIQLALFAADGEDAFDHPLVDMAATRAGLMEQLAFIHPLLKFDGESADRAFMTGILSLMANIYDIAIEDIIANLNLNDEVAAALTDYTGHYGDLLRVMEHLEDLDTCSASAELVSMGINPNNLGEIQLRAFNWRKSA
ncbi:MAG: EAL domain-containing protein [Desulfuromonadaceae bacterium]|nr:EAL domain-containing protein [Desulfuromonadaceae bacterium]MDD2848837.1 EAL domain-containing protein [Desulfuromonadaceae bacterium]MDD4132206.1 EAL domain-containing protein [Desulfuromonadaceae bacterium]